MQIYERYKSIDNNFAIFVKKKLNVAIFLIIITKIVINYNYSKSTILNKPKAKYLFFV